MKTVALVIPHSHTWFWTQTCIASLVKNPPVAEGYDISVIVVDNSPWSASIRGICNTRLGDNVTVIPNHKNNKFHASALDCVVEDYDFDYMMAFETDVMALRPDWFQWFIDQMRDTDYAVGMWHHEKFVNPSCTLYRGKVLRDMMKWCKNHPNPDELRWGEGFRLTAPLDNNLPLNENPEEVLKNIKDWVAGPFAEKRGWPEGTYFGDLEAPSGMVKGPGWYEPGQQLHHWACKEGYTYTICPHLTTNPTGSLPLQSLYGKWGRKDYNKLINSCPYYPSSRLGCGEHIEDPDTQLEPSQMYGLYYTAHLWGGTRALDILKHPVTCQFVKSNTPNWLAREARFWKKTVPEDIQEEALNLIRKYGWHLKGQGTEHVTDRDREAAEYVRSCYEAGGVSW